MVAETLSHLRNTDGIIKKLGKRKSRAGDSSGLDRRHYCLLIIFWLTGCTSLKKAALIGGTSLGAGAIASTVTSGTAPALLAAAGGASAMSVGADLLSPKTGDTTLNNCAPDNFWTLLGSLIEMGGWALILIIILPMIAGWVLPGPLEKKKKK